MAQVRYSIFSLHRRQKHTIWLIVIALILVLTQFFFASISLGEGTIVSWEITESSIHIIWLLFAIYFWSTTLPSLERQKILQLLFSKNQNPHAIIWGVWWGLVSIIIIYSVIVHAISILLSLIHPFSLSWTVGIGNVIVMSMVIGRALLFSLLSSSYITFMTSLILYGVSYSINFLITTILYQNNNIIVSMSLHTIKYTFPRFDLLTNNNLPIDIRWRAVISHLMLLVILYYILGMVFSSRYTHSYENLLHLWHKS